MIEIYDGSQWNEFIVLAHKMHQESSFKNRSFNDDKVRDLLNSPDVFLALYKKEGVFIGFILAAVYESFFGDDLSAYDLALFVDPEHRGSFTVVRLIKTYERWAKYKKVTEMYLSQFTGIDIEKTSKLFSKLGFTQLGCTTKKEI